MRLGKTAPKDGSPSISSTGSSFVRGVDWKLPSGSTLAEFALQSGFLASRLRGSEMRPMNADSFPLWPFASELENEPGQDGSADAAVRERVLPRELTSLGMAGERSLAFCEHCSSSEAAACHRISSQVKTVSSQVKTGR